MSRTEDGARTLATVDRMPIMLPPDLRDDAPEKAWERVLGNTACLQAANVPMWLADAFATGTLNTVGQRSSPTGGGGIGRRSVPTDESTDEKETIHVAFPGRRSRDPVVSAHRAASLADLAAGTESATFVWTDRDACALMHAIHMVNDVTRQDCPDRERLMYHATITPQMPSNSLPARAVSLKEAIERDLAARERVCYTFAVVSPNEDGDEDVDSAMDTRTDAADGKDATSSFPSSSSVSSASPSLPLLSLPPPPAVLPPPPPKKKSASRLALATQRRPGEGDLELCRRAWREVTADRRHRDQHFFSLVLHAGTGFLTQAYYGRYSMHEWLDFDRDLGAAPGLPPPTADSDRWMAARPLVSKPAYRGLLSGRAILALADDLQALACDRAPDEQRERYAQISGILRAPEISDTRYRVAFGRCLV